MSGLISKPDLTSLNEIIEKCKRYAEDFCNLFDISCRLVNVHSQQIDMLCGNESSSFCEKCGQCSLLNTHLFGSHEAYRWDGKYVYYCPAGLTFVASSLSGSDGDLSAALVLGPIVMGKKEDTLSFLENQLNPELSKEINTLPNMTASQVNSLSEILRTTTGYVSAVPHSYAGAFVFQQDKMLKKLYSVRNQYVEQSDDLYYTKYYIDNEKKLKALIKNRDKHKAQELLNEMLGFIYFHNNFNFGQIKTRIIELIVILSRSTIEAGANISEILLINENFLDQLEKLTTTEELSVWITGIMHRFINYTFDFTEVKHANVVHKVMNYVSHNYDKKITLDDIAKHVYLSRTYLSSVFRESIGKSLFAYINEVRIEKSKYFLRDPSIKLADVAMLCGFEDQSYFTKVFKKSEGVSPKKYRDSITL